MLMQPYFHIRVMNVIGNLTRPSLRVGRYQMLKHFDMENYRPPDRYRIFTLNIKLFSTLNPTQFYHRSDVLLNLLKRLHSH